MRMTPHKSRESFRETWLLIDADNKILGRVASEVAALLRGKHLAAFSPAVDPRTFCVVINASKVRLTGNKLAAKEYVRHTTRPGSLKRRTAAEMREHHPEEMFREAVRRMLPKNRLGRQLLGHLKVYAGEEHPHGAQQPQPVALTDRGEVVRPLVLQQSST